jgi:hypothetical protein
MIDTRGNDPLYSRFPRSEFIALNFAFRIESDLSPAIRDGEAQAQRKLSRRGA